MTQLMSPDTFLGGVVEGFYGRPWSLSQRVSLFAQMARWGLNTYFYAPKDDLKHRVLWRSPYDAAEIATIGQLIEGCRSAGLHFIYGLSPGLDIQFSRPEEQQAIQRRFAQLLDAGCHHFALLFDDLPGTLAEEDVRQFDSLAAAQCHVANTMLNWVRSRQPASRFLFCPTPYCDRMARAQLGGADYLDDLGRRLDRSVDLLWTGPEIVSAEISVASIQAVAKRIQRAPVIWDNLHANDYDGRRLFVGPYAGRPVELKAHVAGILSNPNTEFPANFVPLHTLAAYLRAGTAWDARQAYHRALEDWLPSYATVREPLSLEELTLLGDCFYLPFADGPLADRLYAAIACLLRQPVAQWGAVEAEFAKANRSVQAIFEKLTELRDRELFYTWSRRAWELKEELQLFENWLQRRQAGEAAPQLDSHLPGTYRGGFVARLQQLLSMDAAGRFHVVENGTEKKGAE